MNDKLTPFKKFEIDSIQELNTIEESNVEINILILKSKVERKRSLKYRFGCKINEDFFWFFKGIAVGDDRAKSILVFIELEKFCKENNLGIPFLNKK